MKTSQGCSYLNFTRVAVTLLFLYTTSCYAQEIIPGQSDASIQKAAIEYDAIAFAPVSVGDSGQAVKSEQQGMSGSVPQLDLTELPIDPSITPENSAITAAIADGVTTNLALSAGAVEANPLIFTSPLGLVALTGMKIGLVKYAETLPESEKRLTLKSTSALWGGAAVNNLMVLFAAPPPVAIIAGLVMGIATWMNMGSRYEKEDQLLAARNKKIQEAEAKMASKPAQITVAVSN